MKQAEPAICALHRIGLGYSRFAQALYANPIPREVKALGKEGLDEYKAQLAQVTDPLEKKATEGYQLAVDASRDYGVTNSCSREALQALKKAKPDAAEGALEPPPQLAAVAPADPPAGYGLLRDVQAQAAPRPAAGRAAAPLPGLRERTPAKEKETSATNDPQKRVPDADKPIPPKRKGSGDDEDLLP